jgi:hypothetical protein
MGASAAGVYWVRNAILRGIIKSLGQISPDVVCGKVFAERENLHQKDVAARLSLRQHRLKICATKISFMIAAEFRWAEPTLRKSFKFQACFICENPGFISIDTSTGI